MAEGTININISGADAEKKDVVANIINQSLVKEGFTNTAIVNSVGEPMAGSNVPSVLDALKSREPEFFATPIKVWADSPVAEAVVNAVVKTEDGTTVVVEEGQAA
jgi:hypothetical protein